MVAKGLGTSLKPAWEPIIVARKPLDGTVAENVQKWGTGAMNIDGSRIATDPSIDDMLREVERKPRKSQTWEQGSGFKNETNSRTGVPEKGRWPANLILDEEAAAMLDEQSGDCGQAGSVTGLEPSTPATNVYGEYGRHAFAKRGDSGGASRFFYTAKASKADRGHGNTHPTVKPQAVIKYLMQLVTRSGSVVLDPFSGSGTTIKAAQDLGRIGIGLDLERTYIDIGQERTAQQGLML